MLKDIVNHIYRSGQGHTARRAVLGFGWLTVMVLLFLPVTLRAQHKTDTIVVREVIIHRDTVYLAPTYIAVGKAKAPKKPKSNRRDSLRVLQMPYPAWNVKTNLLLWGVVAPNVQVELPLGRKNRWSLELEYFTPWFTWNHNANAHQCQNIGLELRYWPGKRAKRRWLEGWHLGLAVAGGYYDFEWRKHEGYQGEHLNTYLNLGYQHRFGWHWALDAGIGVGAMLTKYRHYFGSSVYPDNHILPEDDYLIYRDKGNYTWLGPCHANLSLVYMFNAWPFHTKKRKLDE